MEWVAILDYGSQYTQLVARRVRALGVFSKILPYDIGIEAFQASTPKAIILSGGPDSILRKNSPKIADWVFTMDVPILGICYGMQAMVAYLGGTIVATEKREYGFAQVRPSIENALFPDDNTTPFQVWMSHGDKVSALPDSLVNIAESAHCTIAAIAHKEKPWYGLQFHPEVTHTPTGQAILEKFLRCIAHCSEQWEPGDYLDALLSDIKAQVNPTDHVLLAASGGVDSTVAAVLLAKVLGKRLHCVFVDNGLLRKNEATEVETMFRKHIGDLTVVHAEKQFLDALKGKSDPEVKRRQIGKTFIEVLEQASKKFPDLNWLAQGTIYPDVIESAAGEHKKSAVIKSHHNVGGLPEKMHLKLIEPLRMLFKDEVRALGMALGLPKEMLFRHPFPGPGLGVRVLGEVEKAYLEKLRAADAIFIEMLRQEGLYDKLSQAFAVFLPVKSVGVIGDARQYDHVVALRAVETVDFMTAESAPLPANFLTRTATRIINEVSGISRVVYDISSKPPATIEWE